MATTPTNNLSRLFQTAGTAKPQQGTGYTNLNSLFEANKQNQLGQKVAGDLGGQIGGVQTQLQQQQKQFTEESEKNRVGGQKDVEQREAVLGRFSSASGAGDQVTEDETKAFGRFTAGQYGGPESLKDTSGLRQTAQQLQGQVSNFSPSGTQELLRQSVGGNRYTQGQSRLDSLLMDRSKLTPVARQAQGLGQEIQRADLAAQGLAKSLAGEAVQFGQDTITALNQGLTRIDTSVREQFASAQQKENARLAAIKQLEAINRGYGYQYDDTGNVKYDEKGQPIKDSTQDYSKLSNFDKLSKMEELLRGKASEEDLNSLFGATGAAQQKTDVQNALNNMYNKYVQVRTSQNVGPGALIGGTYAGSPYLNRNIVGMIDGQFGFAPTETAKYNSLTGQSILADKLKAGIYGDTRTNASGMRYQVNSGIENKLDTLPTSLVQSLLQKSALDQNTTKNLTEQGVASDIQRSNYEALNQLLGKTPDQSKYRTDADKYREGRLVFDPNQLR